MQLGARVAASGCSRQGAESRARAAASGRTRGGLRVVAVGYKDKSSIKPLFVCFIIHCVIAYYVISVCLVAAETPNNCRHFTSARRASARAHESAWPRAWLSLSSLSLSICIYVCMYIYIYIYPSRSCSRTRSTSELTNTN